VVANLEWAKQVDGTAGGGVSPDIIPGRLDSCR
jgi:hypothetical protein